MRRVPVRVQLTAALISKREGFSAECLEIEGLAGRGATVDSALDDLVVRIKERFWETPPPARTSRTLVAPLEVEFTTYDLARLFQRLRRKERSASAVAAKLAAANLGRYSVSYLNNLARCLDSLHREILDAWKSGDRAATTDRLNALSSLDHEAQLSRWKRMG